MLDSHTYQVCVRTSQCRWQKTNLILQCSLQLHTNWDTGNILSNGKRKKLYSFTMNMGIISYFMVIIINRFKVYIQFQLFYEIHVSVSFPYAIEITFSWRKISRFLKFILLQRGITLKITIYVNTQAFNYIIISRLVGFEIA